MKKVFMSIITLIRLSFFGILFYEALHKDWAGVFVVAQAIIVSFLPYILKRGFDIYTPFPLRVGIVFFMCSTLVLGEIADFYNMFWWWDLLLHVVASVGITLIAFISLRIFFNRIELQSSALFSTILAVSTSLAAAVVWEIYEFLIDLFFTTDTPMQPSNTDTMSDLIVSVAGAALIGFFGYRYLKWRTRDVISKVIQDGAVRNS